MTKLYNKSALMNKRRQLRNNMVKAEIVLWSKLKARQLVNLKFRRQHSVGSYIIDFYCAELRLGIELDGPTHEFSIDYDQRRQEYLEKLGIKIIRFNNGDIYYHLDEVLSRIADFKRPPRPDGHRGTPPCKGGDFPSFEKGN